MNQGVAVHTSTRIAVTDPTDIAWRADADDRDRHAFPQVDGYPARGLCGIRWTTRFGSHGNGTCADCLVALREQVRSATAALAAAERDLGPVGDHYAGMPR